MPCTSLSLSLSPPLDCVANPPLLPVSSQAHLFLFDQGCPLPVAATQCDCPLGMQVAGSAWVRGEGGRDMHRRTVPHSLLKSELAGIRDGVRREELPVCPKPRRAAAPLPEFLSPLSCKHSHPSYEGGSKVLDKIPSKKNDGQESVSIGCPPSCYCGSPPSRVGNPVVNDVEFIRQMEHLSLLQKTKLSDKHSSFPSAS